MSEQRLFRRHSHWRTIVSVTALWFAASLSLPMAFGQQTYEPSDPIASIDGDPVLMGELNFLLMSKLRVKDPSRVDIKVRQASSALLVRQHLAMKSLRVQGGDTLQSMLDRQWNGFADEIRRQGSSIQKYCKLHKTNEQSIRRSRDWDYAWRTYLKTMMTDSNLKRFYQMNTKEFGSRKSKVSHIFLPVDGDQANAAGIAEQRIREIAEQVQSASANQRETRFSDLARKESDGATAAEGGAIGWVSKVGDLPAAVMKAIRATDDGAVTAPVRSPLGFHLVLVHESSAIDVPFEKVKDLSKLRRDAAKRLFDALVERQKDAKVSWYIKQLHHTEPNERSF